MTPASAALRYGWAVVAPLLALGLRLALSPLLGDVAPLLIFIVAVALIAWHGGAGPGLVATGLSMAMVDWFFMAPKGSFDVADTADVARLVVFAVAGAAFSLMGEVALRASRTRIQAEQALRDSEQRLRSLGDNLPDSAIYQYTHDSDGNPRFLYFSAGVEALNGVSVADVLRDARTLIGQFAPDDARRLAEALQRSERDLSDFAMELPMRRPDGQQRWMRLRSRPRRLPDGKVVWDGVQTDITERKQRERNLDFLAELQKVFASLDSGAEIARVSSERVAEHLNLEHCMLVQIDQAVGQATVIHDHPGADAARLEGAYPLTDFRTEAERQQLAAGKTLVIDDVQATSRSPAEQARFEARRIRALVSAPYVADGRWKFMLSASRSQRQSWSEEDVDLLTELAARICVRVERARAEEQLRESEQRLRSLGDNLPDSAIYQYTIDADGTPRYLYVSAGIEALRGVRADDVLRDAGTLWRQLASDDAMRLAEARQRSARDLSDYSMEFPFRRPDGQQRWIRFQSRPRRLADGKVVWDGVQTDITERKRRERNLAFLADLQRTFASLSAADDLMRVTSEEIASHLGLKYCTLVRIDQVEGVATVLHSHPPSDAAGMAGVYPLAEFRTAAERQALAAGEPLVIDDVQAQARTPAERHRFESRAIRALVTAPYPEDGRWKFALAASRAEPYAWPAEDVELLTELAARLYVRLDRSRVEAELAASRQRLAGIVESAMDAIVSIGEDQRVMLFNKAAEQMFGCAAAQAIGSPIERFLPQRDRAAHQGHVQRFGESGTTSRGMGRLGAPLAALRADGQEFPIEASISKVDLGTEQLFTVILRDVTERRRAEDLARKRDEALRVAAQVALASKYKSEFLANMSHELRTPLNSLLILSRLLADNRERNLTPKQVEFAEVMHQSGSDLLRLINEILDLSRIEAGQVEVVIESVALAKLSDKLERQFGPVAASKHLGFEIRLDPALPATIRSDAHRLEQVLKNLLANAFKFTEQGRVELTISRAAEGWARPHPILDPADGVIAFAVGDSGIGIAPEKQQLIFEAFAQADGTTSRKYGGTGLGLSISREIAALLGGAIGLTSQPGAGSRFTLYLPFSPTSMATAPRARPEGRQVDYGRHADSAAATVADDRLAIAPGDDVVLLVENDPNFARLLLDIAHRHAFKGLVATNAAAALELARRHRPAAITLSVTLPDMDGWKLLQRVDDELEIRHIPVHIVSGEDERPRGLRQGAVSFLQKPVTEDALGALFERIRATKARGKSLLLVIEDDSAMQSRIQQAIGASSAVETTLVASAEQGLDELRARRYDCVVLDLRLPGMSGFEFLRAVRDELRIDDLPIVVYTGMDLSPEQRARLNQLAETVLIKDANSMDRLLDQASHYLHCPLDALPQPARKALERLHGGAQPLAGAKVLVVDDDMRNVYALLSILEGAGIEVMHADNGRECLEILRKVPDIQAVLMDIMMPEMDGYEATSRIRAMAGRESLPVIALTARAMKGDREKCLAAGASDYLTKPVDGDELLARLRLWLMR